MIIGEKMTPKEIFNILEKEMGSMPQEEKELQEWFETSYNTGNEAVQKALIELLTYDVIRPETDDDKILWVFRNVSHGKDQSRKQLRQMYYEGHGTDSLRCEIVEFMTSHAKKDDLDSIIFLGHIYSAGFGVEKDYEFAHSWYEKAAKQNNAGAQLAMGDFHYHKEEYDKAIIWYEEAGKQNKKTAYIRLSRIYKLGLGVDVDLKKALEYKNQAVSSLKKEKKSKKVTTIKKTKKIRKFKPSKKSDRKK